MAFADQTSFKQRSAGLAGALIIPGTLGALLIAGLAVTQIVTKPEPKPLIGTTIPLPPPPPPEPDQARKEVKTTSTKVVTPMPPKGPLKKDLDLDGTTLLPPLGGEVETVTLPPLDSLGGSTGQTFTAGRATPRNDPGSWVTTGDYRTSWINRELTGTARFDLAIAPSGRVTSCRITQSTGHDVLDQATCRLIAQRARFEPATDSTGKSVAGTYSSSIRWVLPD